MKFSDYANGFVNLLNVAVAPVITALAFAALIWGAVNYFFIHGGDEKKRAEGRAFILWSLLGMAVLFSVWGLVNVLLSTLGFAPGGTY